MSGLIYIKVKISFIAHKEKFFSNGDTNIEASSIQAFLSLEKRSIYTLRVIKKLNILPVTQR